MFERKSEREWALRGAFRQWAGDAIHVPQRDRVFIRNTLAVRDATWGEHANSRVGDERSQCHSHVCPILLEGCHLRGGTRGHGLVVAAAANLEDVVDLPAVVQVLHYVEFALDERRNISGPVGAVKWVGGQVSV